MPVKNIIFDLGGVLLDIDYSRTKAAMENLGITDFDAWYKQTYSNPLFSQLEKGLVDSETFYAEFLRMTGVKRSVADLRLAWNAMLGDFLFDIPAVFQKLAKKYRLFLFSNTNEIHYHAFIQEFEKQFGPLDFNTLFEKAYFSHLLQQRKPDTEAFAAVLHHSRLKAEETLFIDDTAINTEAAASLGIQTYTVKRGEDVVAALETITGMDLKS